MEEDELRDKFAMAALTGIVSSQENMFGFNPERVAKKCYEFADAMLRIRKPLRVVEDGS